VMVSVPGEVPGLKAPFRTRVVAAETVSPPKPWMVPAALCVMLRRSSVPD